MLTILVFSTTLLYYVIAICIEKVGPITAKARAEHIKRK
jgi:hypothetical protein